ncbi:MAG: transketolase C-terminal domain-containing protein [Spirochaetota bacterium]
MELMSLRKAYGEALVEEGRGNRDIVVLEADLGKSTMSCLFKDAYPDRFFEMGIAEQNMASTSAGLSLAGKIPFYSTFAVFAAGRAYDQIRCSIAIPNANVKICASSCGLSDFGDGKTHQSIEDANIICTIPNMTVLNPCDAIETRKMVKAMLRHEGPVYIRINRNDLPVFTSIEDDYEIGNMYSIRKGKDVVIFATGAMVWQSMEAAELLLSEGVSAEVVNVSCLKPLKKAEIIKYAIGKKAIVTAEEATKIGGLGSAVASLIMGEMNLGFARIGIDDEFGTSASSYLELLDRYGLTGKHIAAAAKRALTRQET